MNIYFCSNENLILTFWCLIHILYFIKFRNATIVSKFISFKANLSCIALRFLCFLRHFFLWSYLNWENMNKVRNVWDKCEYIRRDIGDYDRAFIGLIQICRKTIDLKIIWLCFSIIFSEWWRFLFNPNTSFAININILHPERYYLCQSIKNVGC